MSPTALKLLALAECYADCVGNERNERELGVSEADYENACEWVKAARTELMDALKELP